MNTQIFLLLHLTSVILMAGVTFAALADPHPDKRRQFLMMSGTLSLLAVMSGFGLAGMMRIGFPGWVMVKVVCWLVLSGLTPVDLGGYYRPDPELAETAMRPSATLNAIIESL